MAAPGDSDGDRARTGQKVALVIAATMVLWIVAQWIGGLVGLDPRLGYFFDLAAIAALFWSLVELVKLVQRQNRAGR